MGSTVYFVYKVDIVKSKQTGELVLEPAHESIYGLSYAQADDIRTKLQTENPDNLYIIQSRYVQM